MSAGRKQFAVYRLKQDLGWMEVLRKRSWSFIRKYRIDTAAQLLRSGKRVRITDLAYDCGFSSIRTFNRCFQAEYRMSPVEYSKNDRQPDSFWLSEK